MKRKLTENEKETVLPTLIDAGVAPASICEMAVESCQLVRRLPSVFEITDTKSALAYLALRSRACGITLGDDVYIRSEFFDGDHQLPMRLLAHEVTHVAQFRRDGPTRFLMRYLYDYTAGLARGLGDRRAYLEISYEREARRVADAVATIRN